MKPSQKTAFGALAMAALAVGAGACAGPGYYDTAYVYGYEDCYGPYASPYCGYPEVQGSVVVGSTYYRGLRYRDGRFGREYWYRNGWRRVG